MKQRKTHQLRHLFLLVLLAFATQTTVAQGWFRTFWATAGGPYYEDGVYISAMPGFNGSTQLSLFNMPNGNASFGRYWTSHKPLIWGDISQEGSELYHRFSRSATWKGPDSLAVLVEAEPDTGGNRHLQLMLFRAGYDGPSNDQFDFAWMKEIYAPPNFNVFATEVILTDNGNYLALAEQESTITPGNRDLLLVKAAPNGSVLWSSVYETSDAEKGVALTQTPDGRVLILMNRTDGTSAQPWLVEVDANGSVLAETNLSASAMDEATGLSLTADGNLVISGLNHAVEEDIFLLKVDPDGNQIWRQDYAFPGQNVSVNALVEDPEGDIVLAGRHENELSADIGAFVMKVSETGSPNWERIIRPDARDKAFTHLILHPDGGYVLGGWSKVSTDVPYGLLVQTDVNGIIMPGQIYGNVLHDLDEDCLASTGDLPLEDWKVEAYQNDTTIFYGDVDSLGNYLIECDTGNYTVNLITPVEYWAPCVVDTAIHISYLDTVQLDFPVQTAIACPYLTVDHNYFWANPCNSTLFYVEYCNLGPVIAEDAYLEVTLDSVFTLETSQIPPSSIDGQTVTFPLGDIASNECQRLEFTAFTDCDAELGYVACSEAHIYPDSLCLPTPPSWSGAIIESDGFCEGDSVRFILRNVGTEPMNEMLEYIVIEDAVLLTPGNYKLDPGESMEVAVEANGSTFHFMAQQEPGAPGSSQPISTVEGCVGSSGNTASTGFFNQFSQDDKDGFVSSACWALTDVCPLFLISPLPAGFGNEQNIFETSELEYRILFRNTGSEEAARVVVVDTLSPFLDPTTVRPGASSHPYEFDIDGEGVLRFTFPDINLPPESEEEVRSNGFINFRVAQKPGNEVGTVIENTATIRLDFNLPITTNTTRHTVQEPWIEVISDVEDTNGAALEPLSVYPNPSSGAVHFELPAGMSGDAEFKLFDSTGRLILSDKIAGSRYLFERDHLAPGLYFYLISNKGRKRYSGKVILR